MVKLNEAFSSSHMILVVTRRRESFVQKMEELCTCCYEELKDRVILSCSKCKVACHENCFNEYSTYRDSKDCMVCKNPFYEPDGVTVFDAKLRFEDTPRDIEDLGGDVEDDCIQKEWNMKLEHTSNQLAEDLEDSGQKCEEEHGDVPQASLGMPGSESESIRDSESGIEWDSDY